MTVTFSCNKATIHQSNSAHKRNDTKYLRLKHGDNCTNFFKKFHMLKEENKFDSQLMVQKHIPQTSKDQKNYSFSLA